MEARDQQRFQREFARKYFVRFHMSLIVAGTVGGGVLTSRLLLGAGMGSVMLRYALDVASAYLIFLLLVKLWLLHVHTGGSGGPEIDLDLEDASDVVGELKTSVVSSGGGGRGGGFSLPGLDVDGEGCLLVVLFLVLVLAVVLAGGYVIWMAPEILGEAAFYAVVGGSLAGVASRL
ncbi:MAG: hypothetical protein JNK48_05015 [Bryobacterales bacterium]|nr:hypothetical protein [Bryobacterales bacterium]